MSELPNLVVWQRCCTSMSPGPAHSEAGHVFWISMCILTPYTHIHGYMNGQHRSTQTDTLSNHTNMNGTNGLILFSSPADQSEGPLVGNLHIYTIWTPPVAELKELLQYLVPELRQFLQYLAPKPLSYSLASPVWCSLVITHTNTLTHMSCLSSWCDPRCTDPCDLLHHLQWLALRTLYTHMHTE